jgi:hypothetical protein
MLADLDHPHARPVGERRLVGVQHCLQDYSKLADQQSAIAMREQFHFLSLPSVDLLISAISKSIQF